MTMKIGQIETSGVPGRRDAFHVPAILVNSEELLHPGDNIRFTDASCVAARSSGRSDRHAIVDPFVKEIKIGQLFWAMLIPDTVSDLVHHFNLKLDFPVAKPAYREQYDEWESADTARCRAEGCS